MSHDFNDILCDIADDMRAVMTGSDRDVAQIGLLQARYLVTNPQAAVQAGPMRMRLAWAVLKSARGQTCRQARR